jgi:hypothetical protein
LGGSAENESLVEETVYTGFGHDVDALDSADDVDDSTTF